MSVRREAIGQGGLQLARLYRRRSVAGGLLLLAVGSLVAALGGAQQLTPVAVELVSISINGTSGNAASNGVAANSDGSVVAFYSDATDLIRGDTNQMRDVFVRDRSGQVTERVSVSSAGVPGNGPSHATGFPPAIDADGRIVAFYSDATNLVPDDTNGQSDVFVRVRNAATTQRVSLSTGGAQGNGPSLNPSISGDGELVAFQSQASNFVPNDNNGLADIFVRDRSRATTERVCGAIEPNGSSFAPSISANGRFVAFTSAATNLVPTVPDKNDHLDIFVCDRATGAIDIASVSSDGTQGNGDSILPAISEDGRFVAFKSIASNLVPNDLNNLVDVFVRDREGQITERVSESFFGGDSNDVSFPPSISYDGRFVAFGSAANNIVRADVNHLPSVFVRDRMFKLSLLVDVNARGEQANGGTPDVPPSVSGDGKQIGYVSFASNLVVVPDRNETSDVFIAGNPFFCPGGICPDDLVCQGGMCVPEVVPTPTLGPSDCCQCAGNTCAVPSSGACPAGCDPVQQAACLGTGSCATFTPSGATPTPTPTGPTATPTPPVGANDCCQCEGNTCEVPSGGACPTSCSPVRQAACLGTGNCATFTPTATPTATATLGASDCCQCEGNTCEVPSGGACPTSCSPVRQAACLGTGNCATFTPTATPTATATLGANDCCQCEGNTCAAPSDGGCPSGCSPVRQAACLSAGTCATFTPVAGTATATPTRTLTPTPTGPTVTPTATLGANDCCQCGENTCAAPSDGTCPTGCAPVRQAACLSTGTCATFTPVGGTATPTATASTSPTRTRTAAATPTGTQTPVTTPVVPLDRDSCQCAVAPSPQRTRRGVLLWLSGPLMLLIRRLRKRGAPSVRNSSALLSLLCLAAIAAAAPARAAAPFIGLDVGASEPTNGNYRGHVKSGAAVNPYLGYMFNEYLGLQGQIHFSYQGTDFHPNFPNNRNQATTLLGGTVGPRLSIPFHYPFDLGDGEVYGTAQGGYFTGLSGRLTQSAPGFSVGMGIGYKLTKTLTVDVFGRWNRAYMASRPTDLSAGQVPSERFSDDIQWATGGLGLKYTFPPAPPPPPPPPPPVAEAPPPPLPVQRKIVLRNVLFDFDRYNIRPDSAPVLDEAVELLKGGGTINIVAEGHTDSIGTEAYNLKLSQRRADAVRTYLVDHGISADRIRTEGFGESRPVASNDTADGRAQNRRVELRVVQ